MHETQTALVLCKPKLNAKVPTNISIHTMYLPFSVLKPFCDFSNEKFYMASGAVVYVAMYSCK